MELAQMNAAEREVFLEEIRMTRGKVVDSLRTFDETMKVFVYSGVKKDYVDSFRIWEEGHETRHFMELSESQNDEINCPMTVGSLIEGLSSCYDYKDSSYVDRILVNVMNEKGQSTANFHVVQRDGSLYVIGGKPLYEYYDEERLLKTKGNS